MSFHKPASLLELDIFAGVHEHDNFCRIQDVLPTTSLEPSSNAQHWPSADPVAPPRNHTVPGAYQSLGRPLSCGRSPNLCRLENERGT